MRLAIICGSGVDELPCFNRGIETTVSTRFGEAEVIESHLAGREVLLVLRHGRNHLVPPAQVNYRAQIAALRKAGIRDVIGICAVGSLQPDLGRGTFAVLRDFVDLTKRRADTFFDEPGQAVVHTDFTDPYCPRVSGVLEASCEAAGVQFESSAVYVGVEGPRYESPAEIRLYASWGAHVIGMTNLPEAVLAREAGLCYGALAVVTNLAAGILPTPLSHSDVRTAVQSAAEKIESVIIDSVGRLGEDRDCRCGANQGLVV